MKTVALGEVLRPSRVRGTYEGKTGEQLISVRLNGRGATARKVGDGKTPKPFVGYKASAGQFVFSRIWARRGAMAVIPPELDGVVVTNEFPLFDFDATRLCPEYFLRLIQSPLFLRRIEGLSAGASGQNRVNERKFLGLRVEIPSLEEQRRIAAILDQADALRAKRRQVLADLDSLTQSVFQEMFGNFSSAQEARRLTQIGQLALETQYGTAAKATGQGELPILRMGNITDQGRIDPADLKYIDLAPTELTKYTAAPGDLLFNRTNSLDKVGKSAVVRGSNAWAFAGYLVRVRFPTPAWAEYVAGYLRSADGIRFRRAAAKVAVNQANINAQEMLRIPIPVATGEQVEKHAAILGSIEEQRLQALARAQTADELFASLQSRAFRGEL
ncbi:restriction endonuclease subunit S [Microbacterium sp. ZW T6_19]|uniref:restriction endonuclease subunit S n=1 Tax=Microbacterium sp. ZW T6_19 TaxID=3378082 RepID=UPI003853893B